MDRALHDIRGRRARVSQHWRVDRAQMLAVLCAAIACVMVGPIIGRDLWQLPFGLIALAGVLVIGYDAGRPALVLLTVVALLQLPLGTVGPVEEARLAEIVVPVLLLAVIGRSFLKRDLMRPASGSARLPHVGIGLYALVLVANIIRSESFLVTENTLRPFYAYAIALGTYCLAYILLTSGRTSVAELLTFVFYLSVAVCTVGVAAAALGLPLDLGNLRYSVYDYGSGAVRVGFLETFSVAGLALVGSGLGRLRLLAGLLFATAAIVSGGRAAVLGIVVGILLYQAVTWRAFPVLATAVVAFGLALALPSLRGDAQVQRITDINPAAVSSDDRSFLYSESVRYWKAQPLFGTGFGVQPTSVSGVTQDQVNFYQQQFRYGGHATYHALLKNFGLAGFIPFVAVLLLALWQLGRIARRSKAAGFLLIFLAAQAVGMISGGNGSDPTYF